LIRDPSQLSVLEVINAVDPLERIQHCPLHLESHGKRLCPMHQRIDAALATVEAGFRESTIADLLNDPDRPRPLCDREE
jgi:DNA-binding IscR family transcriptional regulator